MRRRDLMALLSGATVWSFAAHSQQSERMRRIGVLDGLFGRCAGANAIPVLREELSKNGWTEGQNAHIEVRWGSGDPGLTQTYAAALVRLEPDVIIANSSVGVTALLRETRTIPIVFMAVPDPVGQGFVKSLARPGGNASGFSLIDAPMVTKWLELLKDLSPGISRVALVFNPDSVPGGEGTYRVAFEAAARSLNVEPRVNLVHSRADLESAFGDIAHQSAGGMIIPPDLFTIAHHKLIIDQAAYQRLPVIYGLSLFTADGGLMSYGPDPIDLHRRAVPYVDRHLKG